MAGIGPMPKPTALRIAEGNLARRPLPKGEPHPRAIVPIAPDHLDEYAHQFYERAISDMSAVTGWVTEAEFAQLEGAAKWYSIWRRADEACTPVDVYVTTFTNSAGEEQRMLKPVPHVKIRKDAWVEFQKCIDRLGLSPAVRTRMVMPKGPDENNRLDSY
jgi:P27 family predicted phage terminase small subunit